MNNLNDTLPDLMRRATENLEPESTDLVERGMRRGTTLRRRRTALLSFTGAGAVLATAGIVIGGTQLFGGGSAEAPVAGTSSAASTAPKQAVTPAQTLETLKGLLPANVKVSAPASYDENSTFHASVLADDGKGASLLTVTILTAGTPQKTCAGMHGTCTVQADGTIVNFYANESIFPYEPKKNPEGIRNTVVEVFRPDGRIIVLYNYNAPKEIDVKRTRTNPLLTADALKKMALSNEWVYPPKHTGPTKPDPKNPGTGKPTVPLSQTLQTLRQVLPKNLQVSGPQTWGGGTNGHNGAAYLVNDGKGLSRVDVLVTHEMPVTKCPDEGVQHCKVRPDGAVVGWSSEEPEYSGKGGGNPNGMVSSRSEIHYPDGRVISMTNYNGPEEKQVEHTRAHPVFTTDQLIEMAGNPAWKFPGTGTK
jgi:hypothetical protein